MVKIKLIGYIAEIFGYREKTVKIEKPIQLKELLRSPQKLENIDQERIIILINGAPATLNSTIKDKDEITMMQIVSGG